MESIRQVGDDCHVNFKVCLKSTKFKVCFVNNIIEVSVTENPINNKVNVQILKEFQKIFKRSVKFKGNIKTRHKCVVIENISCDTIINKIRSL